MSKFRSGFVAVCLLVALTGCAGKTGLQSEVSGASSAASSMAPTSSAMMPTGQLTKAQQLSGLFDGTVTEKIVDSSVGVAFAMHFPDMIWLNGRIYAYYISYPAGYEGRPCIGVATSTDGVSFTKVTDTAIVAGPESYDARMASFAGAWNDGGTVYVVYESTPQNGGADIALATSTDGIHFTKQGVILKKDTSLPWQSYNIGTPDLYKVGDTWYLTFHGYGKDKRDCQIGLAYGKELALGKLTMVQTPVIPTSDDSSSPDSGTTGRRDIVYNSADGYYYMVYEISTDSVKDDYGKAYWTHTFARSKDFMTWETMAPILKQSMSGFGFDGPCFLEIDGQMYVYMRNRSNCTTRISLTAK